MSGALFLSLVGFALSAKLFMRRVKLSAGGVILGPNSSPASQQPIALVTDAARNSKRMSDYLGPYRLGPNDDENCGIYTGDARELSEAMPDESVDLIFTDPVYESIEDYKWLAETASRILKPDGLLLAWQATMFLADTIKVMAPPLNYVWQLIRLEYGPCRPGKTGIRTYTLCLWFDKGNSKRRKMIADTVRSVNGTSKSDVLQDNSGHKWAKHIGPILKWTEAFCQPEGIVFDPFGGCATVAAACKLSAGRRYLVFEIDPVIANDARKRIQDIQPMLPEFLQAMTQLEMAL